MNPMDNAWVILKEAFEPVPDKDPQFFDENLHLRYAPPKGTEGNWRKREQSDSQYAEDDFQRYWEQVGE